MPVLFYPSFTARISYVGLSPPRTRKTRREIFLRWTFTPSYTKTRCETFLRWTFTPSYTKIPTRDFLALDFHTLVHQKPDARFSYVGLSHPRTRKPRHKSF